MNKNSVIYLYDSSFEGFLFLVYESFYSREMPVDIYTEESAPITLYETRFVETNLSRAKAVNTSIDEKISHRASTLVSKIFLSCLDQKELRLLEFLRCGYKTGPKITNMLGDPLLSSLLKAEKHLNGEVHKLQGFIRFADVGGPLVATITPKNFVLPFLASHFTLRLRDENFLIFDKTHKAALIYGGGKYEIISVDKIDFPEIQEEEAKYQRLWKQFYNTLSIESRENPWCRMSHMPKRYWENMVEVQDLL